MPLPESNGPLGSRLLAIECEGDTTVLALAPEDAPTLVLPACETTIRYFLADYAETLVELGLRPGVVPSGECPSTAGIRCTEAPLPSPEPGRFFSAIHEPSMTPSPWQAAEGPWPSSSSTKTFLRYNRCPDFVDQPIYVDGYHHFSGVFLSPDRLILMGEPSRSSRADPISTHFYDVTLAMLRENGLPPRPTATFDDLRGSELGVNVETGEIVVGIAGEPRVLVGRPDTGLRTIAHLDLSRGATRIAARPGSSTDFAVRDPRHPGEIYFHQDEGWTRFDGTPDLVGVCAPPRAEGQRSSMFWLNERELIAMPNAFARDSVLTRSSTNSPDGYWHFVDGNATWRKVEGREPNDCVAHMTYLEGIGLVAATRQPRFFRLRNDQWEALELYGLPQMPFDDTIRDLEAIEHGFAYAREGRIFGYVVDRASCQEVPLDATELENMTSNGQTLLVFGDAPTREGDDPSTTGPASIHLIEFRAPAQ